MIQTEHFTYLFKTEGMKSRRQIKRRFSLIQFKKKKSSVIRFLILSAERLLSQRYHLGKRFIIAKWIAAVLYQEEEHLFSLLMGYRFPRLPNLSYSYILHCHTQFRNTNSNVGIHKSKLILLQLNKH